MKKIVFLFISIITAFTFASCSEDSSTQATAKYVTINLQIGADTTLTLSGGSTSSAYNSSVKKFESGKTLLSTRATVDGVNVPDFVPEVPNTFTAYIVASDINNDGWIIQEYTAEVHTGSNYVTIQAPNHQVNYRVYVTNYSQNSKDWYTWSDATSQLPQSSTTLYLFGTSKNLQLNNNILSGEVKMENYYAAVCIYNNNYILQPPHDNNGNTDFVLSGQWYYCYIRSLSSTTTTNIAINRSTNYKGIREQISPNNIYQYIIDDN